MEFKKDTKIFKTYTVLSDTNWHCAKCELPGTQPGGLIRELKSRGYLCEQAKQFCKNCQTFETHRRMISNRPSFPITMRASIPKFFRDRVRVYFHNREAVSGRKLNSEQLEVDHRFPFTRHTGLETVNPYMDDRELRHRFQLLSRENNTTKREACEHCKRTGERGKFADINFFYEGGPLWNDEIPPLGDERGCYGCFWFDPENWRRELNNKIKMAPTSLSGFELSNVYPLRPVITRPGKPEQLTFG